MSGQILSPEEFHMTLQEVADALGLSVHTVHRHQSNAFIKIRKYCKTYDIKFTDVVESLSK